MSSRKAKPGGAGRKKLNYSVMTAGGYGGHIDEEDEVDDDDDDDDDENEEEAPAPVRGYGTGEEAERAPATRGFNARTHSRDSSMSGKRTQGATKSAFRQYPSHSRGSAVGENADAAGSGGAGSGGRAHVRTVSRGGNVPTRAATKPSGPLPDDKREVVDYTPVVISNLKDFARAMDVVFRSHKKEQTKVVDLTRLLGENAAFERKSKGLNRAWSKMAEQLRLSENHRNQLLRYVDTNILQQLPQLIYDAEQ